MKNFDFYNPVTHKGNLPVRVLPYNFIDWFINITPEFEKEAKAEINYKGLKPGITYHIDNTRITEIACINEDGKIELYENYNQYLWSICYALIVLFDEGIHRPIVEDTYTGKLDLDNLFIARAIDLFNNGLGLIEEYKEHIFFELPNPEKYTEFDQFYIEKTNGIYTAGLTFILLHEFGHQFYGHHYSEATNEESKKEEYAADDFAIEKISYNFKSDRGTTFKIGIVVTLCSFIFFKKSLGGGDNHPDIDERLTKALEKLELNELDNIWGIASLAFRLWANTFKIELNLPSVIDNYKQLYYLTMKKVRES